MSGWHGMNKRHPVKVYRRRGWEQMEATVMPSIAPPCNIDRPTGPAFASSRPIVYR
jgi:hypothetical protein